MKKFVFSTLICCLLSLSSFAQVVAELEVDPSGTSCAGDLEMKVYVMEHNTFIEVGNTYWFPVPTSTATLTWLTLWNGGLWEVDPGPKQSPTDWFWYKVEFRNCNSPSTGTTGPNCSSGYLDGVTFEFPSSPVTDCFEYNGNCGSCNSGQEIEIQCPFADPSFTIVIDDL